MPASVVGDVKMANSLPDTPPRRVLIVDDEEVICKYLRRALRKSLGCETSYCLSGPAALQELAKSPYSVVATDLRMPGLDGFALFKWVKKNRPGLEKRILFTTGDIYEPKTRDFIRQVEFRCISKPFAVDAFVQQVSSLLLEQPAAPV